MTADWISAIANIFGSIGTVSAFAFGIFLYARGQREHESAVLSGLFAEYRRMNTSMSTDDVATSAGRIFSNPNTPDEHLPLTGEASDESRWDVYQLWVQNNSNLSVSDVDIWVNASFRLTGARSMIAQLRRSVTTDTCVVRANSNAIAMTMRTRFRLLYGLSLRRDIQPGSSVHLADVAWINRDIDAALANRPDPPVLKFRDARGLVWTRNGSGPLMRGNVAGSRLPFPKTIGVWGLPIGKRLDRTTESGTAGDHDGRP